VPQIAWPSLARAGPRLSGGQAWRDARAAESARLESVCGATHRGFESHSLRSVLTIAARRTLFPAVPQGDIRATKVRRTPRSCGTTTGGWHEVSPGNNRL